ncbi:MAG: sulfite exporter TauE/SafE family protein [Hyphomicrobiales bacterium]
MPDTVHILLAVCMFVGAALYSSVGHAGASAYIAFMALFSVPPAVMRPTALTLNIFVATFASYRYAQAGYFRWRVVWPFLLGSLPFAFIGGGIQLPGEYYRAIVGGVLILAGLRMLWAVHLYAKREIHDPPIWLSVLLGVGIGFLSGLTGTGGGIFLSPVIIFLAWSDLRTTSGIAAVFISGNSIAGLLGNYAIVRSLPDELPMYVVAVMLGALIGTAFGTKFSIIYIRRVLGVVLIIAGLKLIGVY